MKKSEYDFIILGGGCASLSLVFNLINNKIEDLSFLIIEKREFYTDDRSWCFWERNCNNYNHLIEKSWEKWKFSRNNNTSYHEVHNYSYHYIRSMNFYRKALKLIKKSKNININLGETVLETTIKKHKVYVKTDKTSYFGKEVLDTRPNKDAFSNKGTLFQSFLGYELKLNNNNFEVASIMDDMRINKKNFIFDYILPLSKNLILFETTFFSKRLKSKDFIKKELMRKLKKYDLDNNKIVREEYGVIPMGFIKKRDKHKNYFYGGQIGGAIRASSGYGFLRIQDWAFKCAINLKKNKSFLSHTKEKRIIKYMDKLFLNLLIDDMSISPKLFFNFIKNISPKLFIKFMNGNTNYLECIRVILSMPKRVFIKYLLK